MFCAFSSFVKPELYASVRASFLDWAASGPRQVATASEGSLSPGQRTLDADELAWLKEAADRARENQAFGGFVCGVNLLDFKGWYNFELNPARTEARLTGLLVEPALAELPPRQNPALHMALLALLKEAPDLTAVYLPFGEFDAEDQADLRMLGLAPGDEEGQWLTNQIFTRKTNFLTFSLDLTAPTWYELKYVTGLGLSRLVLRYFARYGFRGKARHYVSAKHGPQGEELEDETGPVTVLTYLPKNDHNAQNLADLEAALGRLALINPQPKLEIAEVSNAEARPFDFQTDYYKPNYRIGRKVVIQILKEDQTFEDVKLEPGDLPVKIQNTKKGFGPQPGYIHPTSEVMLQLIEDHIDPAQHANILDLGTGTGALAITAARLGVRHILAIDPNREAVEIARRNIELNGLESQVVTEGGSLGLKDRNDGGYAFREDLQQRPPSLDQSLPFDAVLANIFTHNLITMCEAISESLRPGGLLISSGIPRASVQDVIDAYEKVGLELVETRQIQGWFGLVNRKKADIPAE